MRRVRRRGNKEKVFGCDLLEHLTTSCQEIPQVLRCCSEFVEQHGIVDGIYRLSGVSSNIQKLRGEFENDANPDMNKDVYLQDIHCVSSLCKAYFRELPNPLLTYQLYDKFAEAVAIQLEEERLVKIRDVLKELPAPHYRTLEFLMRHLVRMASYSSETNMHARNLAIVWAPNLLRSKDIEVSGFNGTAAFMEVRVQSIVVEFILTHVPQLFPEQGGSRERRKSLPSPSAVTSQEEMFFKTVPIQPVHNFGNISPGDGPLAIRPYHAIIEGTDKRKGSLKGKKWMSIFNIGGRFPDPRRKHKHSAKEKERPPLRPARSMDSLSTPSYPNEGPRLPAQQRPPSTSTSPHVTPSKKAGLEVAKSPGAIGGCEYAVTYRRGTGLVSGGAGTQGTYTALDPDSLAIAGNDSVQTRSPGLSTKMGRRVAVHITGPTMVTVPLHITSNLALGVLQGGGGDRVIHRAKDKDGGDRSDGKEADRNESSGTKRKTEEKAAEEERSPRRKERDGVVDVEGITMIMINDGREEEKDEGARKKDEDEAKEDCRQKPELLTRSISREQRAKSTSSNTTEEKTVHDRDEDEYTEMKAVAPADHHTEEYDEEATFDALDVLNSTEAVEDDQELSGYVQDNFEFLDQMDCSVLDHLDCSTSHQINEFSVEPPGHSYDEYEMMSPDPLGLQPYIESEKELNPLRPLSLDLQSRHTKSFSLPYMTSPVHGPEKSSSEEEEEDPTDNSDDPDYSSDDDESMFVKSLPADFLLNDVTGLEEDTESCTPDRLPPDESKDTEEREFEMLHVEESNTGDQEPREVKDENGLEAKLMTEEEEDDTLDKKVEEAAKHVQSSTAVEDVSDNELREDWLDFPPPPPHEDSVESSTMTEENVEEEKEEADSLQTFLQTALSVLSVEETRDVTEESTDQPETIVKEDATQTEGDYGDKIAVINVEMVLETSANDENLREEPAEECREEITDSNYEEKTQEDGREQDGVSGGASDEIWDKLEDDVCKLIEDRESQLAEGGCTAEGGVEDNEEQDKEGKGHFRIEVEEESEYEKITHAEETLLLKTSEDDPVQERCAFSDEEQHHMNSKEFQQQKEIDPYLKNLQEHSDFSPRAGEQKLVVSKKPRVYQVKAVPVVPPKPQHCKITALSLRQQQQQRERRDADRGRESACKGPPEQDGGEGKDRNSPLSMCFDEAVAIATLKREKEKECEKERQKEWSSEAQ